MEAALPHASEDERRAATATQLHQDVTARAWTRVAEWEQVRARQAAAKVRAGTAAAQMPAAQAAPAAPVVVPAPRPVAAPAVAVDDVDQEQEQE